MSEEKVYIGSGKQLKYGIGISVCLSDLPKEYMFEYEGKKYIKLNVMPKRETDQYGKSHYVTVDTYKKED